MKKVFGSLFFLFLILPLSLFAEDKVEHLQVPQTEEIRQGDLEMNEESLEESEKKPEEVTETDTEKDTIQGDESSAEQNKENTSERNEDTSQKHMPSEAELEALRAEEAELLEAGMGEEPIAE